MGLQIAIYQQASKVKAGTEDRNLEAGTEVETMEQCAYWLVLNDYLRGLSYSMQDHLPRVTAVSPKVMKIS